MLWYKETLPRQDLSNHSLNTQPLNSKKNQDDRHILHMQNRWNVDVAIDNPTSYKAQDNPECPAVHYKHTFKHAEQLCCSQQLYVNASHYKRLHIASHADICITWCLSRNSNLQSSFLRDLSFQITTPCINLTQRVSHGTPLQHRSAATAVLMSHCSWKSTLAALLT